MLEGYYEIGKIVNTQGLKGDMRVIPSTYDIKRFELLESVHVYKNTFEILEIERVWYHKNFVILKFKDIDSATEADKYRNHIILIPEDEALPLGENEYYLKQLQDLTVKTEEGEKLGILSRVLLTGANDVYVIKNKNYSKDLLLPAIKQCIIDIDLEKGEMIVKLPDGLREIYWDKQN